MALNPSVLDEFTSHKSVARSLRILDWSHRATPLGMGFGKTRFASPNDTFRLIYVGRDIATSVAETVIRDRFVGKTDRRLAMCDITDRGICEVSTKPRKSLKLLDITEDALFRLGQPTDVAAARNHKAGRAFSERVYTQTDFDGILYRSRLIGRECIAIYDRAVTAKLRSTPAIELERAAGLVPALYELGVELIGGP